MKEFHQEIRNLMYKLLENIPLYFDKNLTLNSDGRKLLSQLLRYLLYEHREYRDLASEVRRNPTIENIIKLAKVVLPSKEVNKVLDIQFKGPYKHAMDRL
ncbi:MAG: hypothetical protein N3E36_07340 [Sulfolobales archaeon]|nr:hypothetical protein [Ignisphaera sp.]MCX8199805.1 hypothetical protein [Sulfolobales archaeon]MDW8084955.1 hypothetical protein [Ignisphaera sp.]